jgi:chromosome segregation ATPase
MNRVAFVLLVILLIGQYTFSQEKRVKSKVASVTVYSLGAQVTRTPRFGWRPGRTVSSSRISPQYRRAIGSDKLRAGHLLAVSFQRNVLDSLAANPEFAKLQARKKELERKIRLEKAQLQSIATEKDVLLANKQLVGTQGVKLEEMKASMAYFRTKLEEYDRTTIEKEEVISGLEDELKKVNRQIQEISSQGRTETARLRLP